MQMTGKYEPYGEKWRTEVERMSKEKIIEMFKDLGLKKLQTSEELLIVALHLEQAAKRMADEYKKHGAKWPRGWMLKHSADRDIIIKARGIILDRADI